MMQKPLKIAQELGDLNPSIEMTNGVCGNEPCIIRTRIPVWVLVHAQHLGSTEEDLLKAYPTLRSEDLNNAWAYYRLHSDEIEQQIKENEQD